MSKNDCRCTIATNLHTPLVLDLVLSDCLAKAYFGVIGESLFDAKWLITDDLTYVQIKRIAGMYADCRSVFGCLFVTLYIHTHVHTTTYIQSLVCNTGLQVTLVATWNAGQT